MVVVKLARARLACKPRAAYICIRCSGPPDVRYCTMWDLTFNFWWITHRAVPVEWRQRTDTRRLFRSRSAALAGLPRVDAARTASRFLHAVGPNEFGQVPAPEIRATSPVAFALGVDSFSRMKIVAGAIKGMPNEELRRSTVDKNTSLCNAERGWEIVTGTEVNV